MYIGLIALIGLQAATNAGVTPERRYPEGPKVAQCDLGQPARQVDSLREIPAQAAAELSRFFAPVGGLADANGAFNSTDVVDHSRIPQRRFVRAYFVRDTWLIWYEHGGLARHLQTLALTTSPTGKSGVPEFRAAPGSSFTGDLCAGSKALLAGARAASDM